MRPPRRVGSSILSHSSTGHRVFPQGSSNSSPNRKSSASRLLSTSSASSLPSLCPNARNLFSKLSRRGTVRPRGGVGRVQKSFRSHEFSGFHVADSFEIHDPAGNIKLSMLRHRSRVLELVAADGIVFALSQAGVCVAYDSTSFQRLCFMNLNSDEVIRSMFYNKSNQSLITVSVTRSDNFSLLRCRSTPLSYIRKGQPNLGFELFERESLSYPGFVEFDDVNKTILTFCSATSRYKIWDMKNYYFLYEINAPDIGEIKISPGIILIVHPRSPSHIKVTLVDVKNGETLLSVTFLLKRSRRLEFIEQFHSKILIKQDSENLMLFDIPSRTIQEVPKTEFVTPQAFIFLFQDEKFLTFSPSDISSWNFSGERVFKFDRHKSFLAEMLSNSVFINEKQDLMITFSQLGFTSSGRSFGAVLGSDLRTGECLFSLDNSNSKYPKDEVALTDVTSLSFDEENQILYTGDAHGVVHIWSQ